MIILAMDVTSPFGSMVVRADGKTVASLEVHSTDGFGHLVLDAVDKVLKQGGVAIEQVDCFASASGPGAFTGVRVGLAAVKGLAEALNKQAAGISNLRALSTFGTADRRAVLLDARRGDVFGAVYDSDLEVIVPETVTKLPEWLRSLPSFDYEFIVQNGFEMKAEGKRVIEAPRHSAEAVAICAERDGADGKWSDPAALDANYVRHSDAELSWSEAYVRPPSTS